MADGKWIPDIESSTPLGKAAREVLRLRLGTVQAHLPRALTDWQNDPEHVHQLRVGTRRAGAALAIFADQMPAKIHRRAKRALRRLRRAAGAARDWDVFALALADRARKAPARQQGGLDFLSGYAHGQRGAAQVILQEAGEADPELSWVKETLASIESNGDGNLGGRAREWLTATVSALDAAAAGDLADYDKLHQLRILGKRLRYGLEIFAGCYGSELREVHYPLIEELQEILGLANDSHVATQRLHDLRDCLQARDPVSWKRWQPGVQALLTYHQRRLPQQRRSLAGWWPRWQAAGLAKYLE